MNRGTLFRCAPDQLGNQLVPETVFQPLFTWSGRKYRVLHRLLHALRTTLRVRNTRATQVTMAYHVCTYLLRVHCTTSITHPMVTYCIPGYYPYLGGVHKWCLTPFLPTVYVIPWFLKRFGQDANTLFQ